MIVSKEVVVSKNKIGFIIKETHRDAKTKKISFVYMSAGPDPFETKDKAQAYLDSLNQNQKPKVKKKTFL